MKFKLRLYPETRRLLFSNNLIQQTLADLVPSHRVEQKENLYLTIPDKEYAELKVQCSIRGVSMTFLLNEALIKRGRKMEANTKGKPEKAVVVYLDNLLKMHPQIHDYPSLMATLLHFYYVPSPNAGMYILTNRVQQSAFKIAEEATELNVTMRKNYWHVMTEDEFNAHIPQVPKSYIGRLE